MFRNHPYDEVMTWGDVFRLFKYWRRFQAWDAKKGTRLYKIYPNELT